MRSGDDEVGQAHEGSTLHASVGVAVSVLEDVRRRGDAAGVQTRRSTRPRSTDARCAVPSTSAHGTSACGDRWCERCVLPGRVGDDVANLGAVRDPGEQRIDAVRAEKPCDHLVVHLDEQWVPARLSDHRVGRTVEFAQLVDEH